MRMSDYLIHHVYANPEILQTVGYFQAVLGNDKDYLASESLTLAMAATFLGGEHRMRPMKTGDLVGDQREVVQRRLAHRCCERGNAELQVAAPGGRGAEERGGGVDRDPPVRTGGRHGPALGLTRRRPAATPPGAPRGR